MTDKYRAEAITQGEVDELVNNVAFWKGMHDSEDKRHDRTAAYAAKVEIACALAVLAVAGLLISFFVCGAFRLDADDEVRVEASRHIAAADGRADAAASREVAALRALAEKPKQQAVAPCQGVTATVTKDGWHEGYIKGWTAARDLEEDKRATKAKQLAREMARRGQHR